MTTSQRSRRLRRHPRSHASNIHIDLPDTQTRYQIIVDSLDQVLRNHSGAALFSRVKPTPVPADGVSPTRL